MAKKTNNLGKFGEDAAVKYLKKMRYKILDRNFQNNSGRRIGEIDIIARDPQEKELVFVEVKTRQYPKFKDTNPEENITYIKMKRLTRIANVYLKSKHWEDSKYRFDAISVWLEPSSKKAKIKHIFSL